MRRTMLAIALVFAVTAVLAHLYVESQVYYPVVQLDLPDGLSVTALLPQTKERQACGASNDRFLAPFKEMCPECRVAMARCERELEGLELDMRRRQPLTHPMVITSDVRIAVLGPAGAAKAGCEIIAKNMTAKGVKGATCVAADPSARHS